MRAWACEGEGGVYESMGMLGWRVCEHGHVRVRVECMRAWGC